MHVRISQTFLGTHIMKMHNLYCGRQEIFGVENYLEMWFEADELINCRLVLIVMDELNNSRVLDKHNCDMYCDLSACLLHNSWYLLYMSHVYYNCALLFVSALCLGKPFWMKTMYFECVHFINSSQDRALFWWISFSYSRTYKTEWRL